MSRLNIWIRKLDSQQEGRNKITVFENKVLRMIVVPTLMNGILRIKHNDKIHQLSKDPGIKLEKLEVIGCVGAEHILRKEENSIVKTISFNRS